MYHIVINFLTAADITSEDLGSRFFALMRAHIPSHLPSVCGNVEPLAIPFDDHERVCSLWPKGVHWQGTRLSRKGDFALEGNVTHGKFWHTWIRHWYQATLSTADGAIAFLREASRLCNVDYAYAHAFMESTPGPDDKLLEGLVSHELQASLPAIPAICCFGAPYLAMIGKDRIASAPFWEVEDIAPNLLLCQAARHLIECVMPDSDFSRRREAIKAAIGSEYFFDPIHPLRKAMVPRFEFLRTRS